MSIQVVRNKARLQLLHILRGFKVVGKFATDAAENAYADGRMTVH